MKKIANLADEMLDHMREQVDAVNAYVCAFIEQQESLLEKFVAAQKAELERCRRELADQQAAIVSFMADDDPVIKAPTSFPRIGTVAFSAPAPRNTSVDLSAMERELKTG